LCLRMCGQVQCSSGLRWAQDRYFVKRFGFASDWIMRVSGDRVGRQYLVWRAGIMDRSPGCIDHTVVAMDVDGAARRRC